MNSLRRCGASVKEDRAMGETLTHSELKKRINYNPETGVFIWLPREAKNWNSRWAGKVAGSKSLDGYVAINLHNKLYKAHRLAWLYMTGKWPELMIDHINHDKMDNRFVNLREADFKVNGQNAALRSTNTSGHNGVCWHKNCNLWRVRIKVDNKHRHIGYFKNLEDAVKAREEANRLYNYHPNHGKNL